MLRAVLDANVFVSALIAPPGPPGKIVAAFLEREAFRLVLSPSIAAEVSRVLAYPKLRRYWKPGVNPQAWFADIALLADLAADGPAPAPPICADPDDDKYLVAARYGRADCVVSGDDALLAVGAFEGIAIVTPRLFLGLIAPGRSA